MLAPFSSPAAATVARLSSGGPTALPSVSFAMYRMRVLRSLPCRLGSSFTIFFFRRATDMVLSTVTSAQDASPSFFTQKVRALDGTCTVALAPDAVR